MNDLKLDAGLQLFTFVKQGKGTDITKVTGHIDEREVWYVSKKYDGFYTQIHWDHTISKCLVYTSSGKVAEIPGLTKFLADIYFGVSFIFEAEYIYECEGKLGDRVNSARLMSCVSNTAKGIANRFSVHDTFKAFDCLMFNGKDLRYEPFSSRISKIPAGLSVYFTLLNLEDARAQIEEWTNDGWEGGMLRHKDSIVKLKGRNKQLIKIKQSYTVEGICISTKPGTGKYAGMIGALNIEVVYDGKDYIVTVGSGLTDEMRAMHPNELISKFYTMKVYGSMVKLMHPVLV